MIEHKCGCRKQTPKIVRNEAANLAFDDLKRVGCKDTDATLDPRVLKATADELRAEIQEKRTVSTLDLKVITTGAAIIDLRVKLAMPLLRLAFWLLPTRYRCDLDIIQCISGHRHGLAARKLLR